MSKQYEELVPLDGETVKMYACGPTVYDFFHVGNARCFVVFDFLRRYLEYRGYKVNFTQNFTDIDDKMIKRANEEGTKSPSAFLNDAPRATSILLRSSGCVL